jgi:hypothetical protein
MCHTTNCCRVGVIVKDAGYVYQFRWVLSQVRWVLFQVRWVWGPLGMVIRSSLRSSCFAPPASLLLTS